MAVSDVESGSDVCTAAGNVGMVDGDIGVPKDLHVASANAEMVRKNNSLLLDPPQPYRSQGTFIQYFIFK